MSNFSRRSFLALPDAPGAKDPLIHVASLLVQATPAGCEQVRRAASGMKRAELHETGHPGKLALVLESSDSREIAVACSELQELSGVLAVSIVAHLTEHESLLDETE